jgi:pyruvate kinase
MYLEWLSHADYEGLNRKNQYHQELLNDEFGYTTAILADLQGP